MKHWPLIAIVLTFLVFLALVDPVTKGMAAVAVGEIVLKEEGNG